MTLIRKSWLLLFILSASLCAQTINPPPVPHWLQSPSLISNQSVYFRKTFQAELPLLKAILMAACDDTMTIYINGTNIGEVGGRERAATFDVTSHIRRGANNITIRTDATNRMSALLELNGDLARKSWIATDTTWLTTTNTRPDSTMAISAAGWFTAHSRGTVDAQPQNPFRPELAIDAYNSWKLALKTNRATEAATLTLLPGFKAELLRSSQPGEGSWVALAFDPKGRLTVAREKRGLLRFTIASDAVDRVEVIDDTLLECRGLLYAHGSLYVNANNSKGFYRLRDTNGDDEFDKTELLLRTEGGVGHGRNGIVLGPNGSVWLVHGNNVHIPAHVSTNSPLHRYAHDAVIPCPFDDAMFDGDVLLPAGHILRTDANGSSFDLFAGGFRNPLDLAFNRDGEMFTFDADMEWDVGSPWYRPNRVNHVISGADYGWRRGTSKWPDYFPDTPPSTLDIGLASPTGVESGTASRFPPPYNDALYIADWAYGRILAVHLEPSGASYRATSELFVTGRPLNITDLTFGPDGAMYFVTGGRDTQAGLYRIRYAAPWPALKPRTPAQLARESEAKTARELRHRLESFHRPSSPDAIDLVWPHLGHSDAWIRHAARVALEHQQPFLWHKRALGEKQPAIALTALMALARVGDPKLQKPILQRAMSFAEVIRRCNDDASRATALTLLRACELALTRMGKPDATLAAELRNRLEPLYPASHWQLNHRLCVLLVYLESTEVLSKTLELLTQSNRAEDLMHYLFYLRYVRSGWTHSQREAWLRALARGESQQGARDYFAVLNRIRDDMLASLSPAERDALRGHINPATPAATSAPELQFVKEWRLDDFDLSAPLRGRSFTNGATAFRLAQCNTCHRFGSEGGLIGPDLTEVSKRFDRRSVLESTLDPSKVIDEKYRQTLFVLKDGTSLLGTIDREDTSAVVPTCRRSPRGTAAVWRQSWSSQVILSVFWPAQAASLLRASS